MLLIILISALKYFALVNGFTTVPSFSGGPDSITLSIDEKDLQAASNMTGNGKHKLALRYGFHDTSACMEFDKAWICIRKCLDLSYDVARADRNCNCRCFKKPGKNPFKHPDSTATQTNWMLGVPTTTNPPWLSLETLGPFLTTKVKKITNNTNNEQYNEKHDISNDGNDEESKEKTNDGTYTKTIVNNTYHNFDNKTFGKFKKNSTFIFNFKIDKGNKNSSNKTNNETDDEVKNLTSNGTNSSGKKKLVVKGEKDGKNETNDETDDEFKNKTNDYTDDKLKNKSDNESDDELRNMTDKETEVEVKNMTNNETGDDGKNN